MNDESELKSKNEVISFSQIWGKRLHNLDGFSIYNIRRFNDTEKRITEDENYALTRLVFEIVLIVLLRILIKECLDYGVELAYTIQGVLVIGFFWEIYAFYKKMSECRARRKKIVENPKWREFFDTYHALVKNFNLDERCIHNETGYRKKTVSDQIALRIKQLKARQRDSKYAFDVLQEREVLLKDYDTAWQLGIVDVRFEAAMANPQ